MRTYVTKVEAAEEGGALVSIVIESGLGPIELEILGDLVLQLSLPPAQTMEDVDDG
jgi:hypothetical protein